MNILVAKSIAEAEQWSDIAVVADVLRAGTTACALLNRGKKEVLVFDEPTRAEAFLQTHSQFEVYSDLPLAAPHKDDSPYLASRSEAQIPALLVSHTGTQAMLRLQNASMVLLGGFCNFDALASVLRSQKKDVLLIPAAMYGVSDDVEDGLCVSALKDYLQGVGRPQNAIAEFRNTIRFVEFKKQGPKTADKDAKLAFQLNSLPVVPQISFSKEGYGVCHPFGQPAPFQWMGLPAPEAAETQDRMPQMPQGEAAASMPQTSAQPEEKGSSKFSSARVKNLFSDILKVVKEEKKELEQEAASLLHKSEGKESAPVMEPLSDDLLDSVLKKSADAPAQPEQPADEPNRISLSPDKVVTLPGDTDDVTFSSAVAPSGGKRKKKAIVLFSGGLDSTTCLYWALAHGYECEALTVSYGQRHDREVLAAQMIARNLGVKHHLITLNLPWLECCSLVNKQKALPDVAVEDIPKEGIPSTYVPGRNLMFLSIAGSLLDAVGADAIIAGPNAVDFSGYPDCTPAFFKAAAEALNRGTKTGVSEGIEVLAPLMRLSKAQIVKLGAELKVPFELTWSCYAGGQKPCGHCDSCKLRAKGFAEAGVHDTALD